MNTESISNEIAAQQIIDTVSASCEKLVANKYPCWHGANKFSCKTCRRVRCEHNIKTYRCSRCGGPEIVAKQLFSLSKRRAKLRNVVFSITCEQVYKKVLSTKGFCPVLNLPLIMGGLGRSDNSPSLDRHDNTKGYTNENVFVIPVLANRLKNNGTAEQLMKVAKYAQEGIRC